MKYKVTHTTTYTYSETVPVCHNKAHVTPRELPRQDCAYHRLTVRPRPSSFGRGSDYFGNPVCYFSIHEGHRRMSVTAVSRIEVRPEPPRDAGAAPPWHEVRQAVAADRSPAGLEIQQFLYDSPAVPISPELAAYAGEVFTRRLPVLEGVRQLTQRIHAEFQYDQAATSAQSTVHEVFRLKRGVCQDLAHVQIGCLRALGLPARYVSGYLRTLPPPGGERLVGADASHAWVAAWCGPLGWIAFDPTNNLEVGTDHVTLAWGRDYSDVCPIEGVFVGGGQHELQVSVDVQPLNGP